MNLKLENGRELKTGKLVIRHAMEAMAMQKKINAGEIDELGAIEAMIEILAESLVNGTERIHYDEITVDKMNEYKKLIMNNVALSDIEPIYVQLLNEMSGKNSGDEGK